MLTPQQWTFWEDRCQSLLALADDSRISDRELGEELRRMVRQHEAQRAYEQAKETEAKNGTGSI